MVCGFAANKKKEGDLMVPFFFLRELIACEKFRTIATGENYDGP